MPSVNRQITLAARPVGLPRTSDFKLVESALPEPGAGEVLVRTLYLSVDPYMRGLMGGGDSYARSMQIGEVLSGGAVGQVVQSRDPGFAPGDFVQGMLGWQEYAVLKGSELHRLDPNLAPVSTALGVLGMPGLTAYFGLLEIGEPQPGETVVVSGAAGAVGSVAGQIGKIKGCRVVGIAGSDAKIQFLLEECGFDAAFNYRAVSAYAAKIRELCPAGIDVYFDNVGGPVTDAVMGLINTHARVVVCGQISQYNLVESELGPRWLGQLIAKQAKVQGFLVSGYASRFPEGLSQLAQWLKEGRLKYREDLVTGIENAPQAFIGMLQGHNIGKQLVLVAEP